jgi:hypothetical protein
VIFAVRLIKDTQSQIARSKELLESVGANVIGVVVNGADESGEGRYGYGYGYRGYGYGYGYGGYGYGSYGTYGNGKSNGGYFDDEDAAPGPNTEAQSGRNGSSQHS